MQTNIDKAHERIHVRKDVHNAGVERELINLTDAVVSVGRDLVQAIEDLSTDLRRSLDRIAEEIN